MAFSYPETEADFVYKVKSDLTSFVEISSDRSVLVFPPVNGFYRFLIHQLAQDNFEQLRTFSIGEDPDRRIVVCTKALVARIDAGKDEQPQPSLKIPKSASQLTMVVSDAERINNSQVKKQRSSLPTVGIYRPPAARRLTEDSPRSASLATDPGLEEPSAKHASKTARPRVRRPDQQVYVPRAKRAFQDSDKFEDASAAPVENQSAPRVTPCLLDDQQTNDKSRTRSNLIIEDRKPSKQRSSSPAGPPVSLPPRASQLVEIKKKLCQSTSNDLDFEGIEKSMPSESGRLSATMSAAQSINLPQRAEVLVEKKKKLCQSDSLIDDYKWKPSEEDPSLDTQKQLDGEVNSTPETGIRLGAPQSAVSVLTSGSEISPVIDFKVTNISSVIELEEKCDILQLDGSSENNTESREGTVSEQTSEDSKSSKKVTPAKSEDVCLNFKCGQGCESSDDDFQDAHNEKSNGLSNMSDRSSRGSSESISSSDSVNAPVTPVQLIKPVKVETTKKTSPSKTARIFNPDECDWDALLDEDGDVIDPFLMKELTSAVGEVQVTQPKSDYRNYRSQVPADQPKTRRSTGDEDFSHVVEIFSFPPEFKTNDLVAVFSPFKNSGGGFEIKWVDDTHALGVFASSLVAEQVLEYQHPMVRTRPLCDGTLESRLKARRLSESIHSFRPRPETCAALARRLVTGALGVKLATARQEREEEKRVLKEAREKRRLAAQQRDDIWNSS